VNRNLLTRMATASAVVAVLVAAVFIVLVLAVRDQQASSDRAGRAEQIVDAAVAAEIAVLRGVSRARREIVDQQLIRRLRADPDLGGEAPNVAAALNAVPGSGRPGRTRAIARLEALSRDVRLAADRRRAEADSAARRAVAAGFVGLVASALLMGLLAAYLRRAVVLPLRRVAHAAAQMAGGDLSARVTEGGDAEPADLARSFNRMAGSLQQAQEQLREENQATSGQARISRAVLDATPDPTGLFGPAGEVLLENAPMTTLREELGELLTPQGENLDRESRDELVHGERTLLRYAAPVRDSTHARMGRLVVLRDISAEREAERFKDEFFALVSHELRTPLTSIIGYLELVLDDEQLDDDARRYLEVVDRNAQRLLRLVGDMLFVAQVDAGRLQLEHEIVDLAELAADSVEAAQPAADRAGVRLLLEADTTRTVTGDRDRIGQLLDNLISNAVKFSPQGGRVRVRVADAPRGVALQVSDEGLGIPQGDQEHLFERFFRSSSAALRAVPGAGLGLAIVKAIAEAHGGRVSLRSLEGDGTTVRAELPASPRPAVERVPR